MAKTPQELKIKFLEQAEALLDDYMGSALGTSVSQSTNIHAREEVWDLLKKLILKASDKITLEAGSPEAILKAVETGKCTVSEARELLGMYKQVKEINQEQLDHPLFNIVIQGVDSQHQEVQMPAVDIEVLKDSNKRLDYDKDKDSDD